MVVTALLILGGVELTDDKVYGCEARSIVMPCERLSKYYSLPNGKCYNSELGNKLCRSGWTQEFIVEDEIAESEPAERRPEYYIAYVNNCASGRTDKYICKNDKCQSTAEILSELG